MRASGAKRLIVLTALLGCTSASPGPQSWDTQRESMVQGQLAVRGIENPRVLAAMRKVPRHEFVPERLREQAYQDRPLPIGEGQTISQPYIVGYMTELIEPRPGQRVLEIGTGSGYQAAVLAELVGEVYTIELLRPLADSARQRLERLGYRNVHVKAGDGYKGWPEKAPFDAVVVTCGAREVPEPLFAQLKEGGRMVIPVGDDLEQQTLKVIKKLPGGKREVQELLPVRFVPLRRAQELPKK
jgi:protein-L-isoaspartate(D-aspartate) O-methyltransferase